MKIKKIIMAGLAFCLLSMLAVSNLKAEELLVPPYCSGLQCNISNGCLKDETPVDGFTVIAPTGSYISQVWVKGSDICTPYTVDTNDGCYNVSGIGTATVTVTKVGIGPACPDISHIEGIIKPTAVTISSFSAKCRPDNVILVRWDTSFELNSLGFNVWRSTKLEDPRDGLQDESSVQLNRHLIPALGDSMLGGSYAFKDRNFSIGTRYFYYLEEVDTHSLSNWYDTAVTARCVL